MPLPLRCLLFRKVSFFAVAPAPVATNGIELVTSGGYYTGYPSFTVTTLASPAQQLDICVASAPNCTDTANGGKVHLNFTHAMAKVKFSVKYVSAKTFGVVLGQLKFSGIYTGNTLQFTSSGFAWGAPTATGSYTLSVVERSLVGTPLIKADEAGDTQVSTEAGMLLLVPQTVSGAKLEATFWVGDTAIVREITMPKQVLEAVESHGYSLIMNDNGIFDVLNETQWDWSYTGDWQTFVAPKSGTYKLEAWGAGGPITYDGKGGYVRGTLTPTWEELPRKCQEMG
ncbi:MAG: fimbrillin family protein [Prevotellaceae bacterium]|jgi:hypothetical protein|nr:fimbrillin family protein [Prevotellaceae bacterium]